MRRIRETTILEYVHCTPTNGPHFPYAHYPCRTCYMTKITRIECTVDNETNNYRD